MVTGDERVWYWLAAPDGGAHRREIARVMVSRPVRGGRGGIA